MAGPFCHDTLPKSDKPSKMARVAKELVAPKGGDCRTNKVFRYLEGRKAFAVWSLADRVRTCVALVPIVHQLF